MQSSTQLIAGIEKLTAFFNFLDNNPKRKVNAWTFFQDPINLQKLLEIKEDNFKLQINLERAGHESMPDYKSRLEDISRQLEANTKNFSQQLQRFSQFMFMVNNNNTNNSNIDDFKLHSMGLIKKMESIITNEIPIVKTEIDAKLESLKEKNESKEEIEKNEEQSAYQFVPAKPNTVVLRKFVRTKPGDERKTIANIPSDEHMSIEICLADGRHAYVSLYTVTNGEPLEESLLKPLTQLGGMPSLDVKQGEFRNIEHDIARVNHNMSPIFNYYACEEVVFECDERFKLDIDSIYEWAHKLRQTYTKDNVYPYSLFSKLDSKTDNCATLCLKGLFIGLKNSVDYPLFQSNFIPVPYPTQAMQYARLVQNHMQVLNVESNINNGDGDILRKEDLLKAMVTLALSHFDVYILNETEQLRKQNKSRKNKEEINSDFLILLKKSRDVLLRLQQQTEDNKLSLQQKTELLDKSFSLLISKMDYTKLPADKFDQNAELQMILKKICISLPQAGNIFLKSIDQEILNSLQQKKSYLKTIEYKYLEVTKKIKMLCNDSEPATDTNTAIFHKSLTIADKIHWLKNQIAKEEQKKQNKDNDYIQFMQEIVTLLRAKYGEINQFLYFNRNHKGMNNEQSELLSVLKKYLPGDQQNSPDLAWSVYTAKNNFQVKQDFTEIPSVFNPFKWFERHRLFKEETRNQIYKILSAEKPYQTKVAEIQNLINERKPSKFKFWRTKERADYEKMEQQAQLICFTDAFAKGQIDISLLIICLEKLAATFKENKDFTSFIERLKTYRNTIYTKHDELYKGELAVRMKAALGTYAQKFQLLLATSDKSKSIEQEFEKIKDYLPQKSAKNDRSQMEIVDAASSAPQKTIEQLSDELYHLERKVFAR